MALIDSSKKRRIIARNFQGAKSTLLFNPTTCLSQLMEYSIMTYANYTNR
jgi:hypothetical protein